MARPRTEIAAEILYRLVDVEVLLKRWVVRDGERVLIAEVDARAVPGASRPSSLICECDHSIRRLWNFPDDWNRMADAKLLALFEQPHARPEAASEKRTGQLVADCY